MPLDLNPALVAELLALGTIAGFLAGLLGVGGGMMMVPAMTWLLAQRGVESGLAVKMAVATSMSTILFTSLSSVRAHQRLGAVRWPIVRAMVPGILLGGLAAGGGVFALLKGQALALAFSAFISYTAVQMLLDRKPSPARALPGAAGLTGVGFAVGFLSSLVGAGGAFLSVPFMTWCNVPPRQAVGTSAALGFPIAAAGVLGYLISGWGQAPALPGSFGYLWLPALLIVSTASVLLAPLGARTAQRIDVKLLKRFFAVMLFALAASMLQRAFAP
ncbi:MAG: sulfite exporter TauE/SafE family protein [Rubrivivax sp.]|nr:sulfite exporter TauE/SafE family protein [Rubrivivax sp.]